MLKYFFKFSLILISSTLLVFGIHLGFLFFIEYPIWGHYIIPSYSFNLFTALFFYLALAYVSRKDETQMGWFFLLFSGLKFLLFFVLIYPLFKADGVLERQEFITFFVPYVSCLFIEISQLIKFLNSSS